MFFGALIAQAVMMTFAVGIGIQLSRRLGKRRWNLVAAALFVAGGCLLLVEAFLP